MHRVARVFGSRRTTATGRKNGHIGPLQRDSVDEFILSIFFLRLDNFEPFFRASEAGRRYLKLLGMRHAWARYLRGWQPGLVKFLVGLRTFNLKISEKSVHIGIYPMISAMCISHMRLVFGLFFARR